MLLAVALNKVDIVSEILGRTNTKTKNGDFDDSTSNRVVRALDCLITAVSSVFPPATSETTISYQETFLPTNTTHSLQLYMSPFTNLAWL